jgi:hypothetical protein
LSKNQKEKFHQLIITGSAQQQQHQISKHEKLDNIKQETFKMPPPKSIVMAGQSNAVFLFFFLAQRVWRSLYHVHIYKCCTGILNLGGIATSGSLICCELLL